MKVAYGGSWAEMRRMAPRSPTAERRVEEDQGEGQDGRGGMGEPVQRFKHRCTEEWLPDLRCPEASPLVLGLLTQMKKLFSRGTSSLAVALPYLPQNQRAVPCSSSNTQQHGSDEEKGPRARGTGRHNKEKARRHRQNNPCALSHSFRLSCQKKHGYLLPIFPSASRSSYCDMGEKSPALLPMRSFPPRSLVQPSLPLHGALPPSWIPTTTWNMPLPSQALCCHARPTTLLVSSLCFTGLFSSAHLLG